MKEKQIQPGCELHNAHGYFITHEIKRWNLYTIWKWNKISITYSVY